MKRAQILALSILVWAAACGEDEAPNDLGGDPDTPLGQVGNQFTTGSVTIGGVSYDFNATATVTANDNGIVTMTVVADLSSDPVFSTYDALIPDELKNADGVIETQFEMKMTTEGIQDTFNLDEEMHTVVKYDAAVGDTYKLTKSDGNTITRTVTARSDEDDFPYGFYQIKTITVEQDSRIPGIEKIVYRANHKFGIVYVEIFAEDGSSAGVYLYSSFT